jgi:hypothetical protein
MCVGKGKDRGREREEAVMVSCAEKAVRFSDEEER